MHGPHYFSFIPVSIVCIQLTSASVTAPIPTCSALNDQGTFEQESEAPKDWKGDVRTVAKTADPVFSLAVSLVSCYASCLAIISSSRETSTNNRIHPSSQHLSIRKTTQWTISCFIPYLYCPHATASPRFQLYTAFGTRWLVVASLPLGSASRTWLLVLPTATTRETISTITWNPTEFTIQGFMGTFRYLELATILCLDMASRKEGWELYVPVYTHSRIDKFCSWDWQ